MPRLDQLLASLGYGSRRDIAQFVRAGRVTIDGQKADRHDFRVTAEQVQVDGAELDAPDGLFVILHKPVGYVCTHGADEGATVYDLLPSRWSRRNPTLASVGRLDKDTSGLLLLTDQGQWLHRLTSPRAAIEKTYLATVEGVLRPELVATFASGAIMLRGESKPCLPAKLEILEENRAALTLTEGRYHQVRRMFASQGHHVSALHRIRFGPWHLQDLPPAAWRQYDLTEVAGLMAKLAGQSANA